MFENQQEKCSIKEMLTGISADAIVDTMKALDKLYFKNNINHEFKYDRITNFWLGVYCGIARELWVKGEISKLAYDTIFDYFYNECV